MESEKNKTIQFKKKQLNKAFNFINETLKKKKKLFIYFIFQKKFIKIQAIHYFKKYLETTSLKNLLFIKKKL